MNSPVLTAGLAIGLLGLATCPAAADGTLRSYKAEIIAKAQPDEWFRDLYDPGEPGSGDNHYVKEGIDPTDEGMLASGALPKTNQSYVWGMVRSGNHLWWGTGPNVNRLVGSTYLGDEDPGISRSRSRGITFSVAEYGLSRFCRDGIFDGLTPMGPALPAAFGDWRPPDIFRYNLDTDELERLDLDIKTRDPAAWALLWRTLGLRSAGRTGPNAAFPEGLVILAGPSLASSGADDGGEGIIMFAFDAASGDFVGAKSFPEYTNIRKWTYFGDQAYTTAAAIQGFGRVLRWSKETATAADPLVFQIVGNLSGGGAELTVHDDGDGPRLFVNTWPGGEGTDLSAVLDLINSPASLWRSPVIPPGGLTSGHATQWTMVWSVVDYEPDMFLALMYGGGAMASFDGWLYWGTMHVPGTNWLAHSTAYGSPDPIMSRPDPYPEDPEDPARVAYESDVARYQAERTEDQIDSYRAISIWRGRNFTNNGGEIELLYGSAEMPVRLQRKVFCVNTNEPRSDFDIFWASFFSDYFGNFRNVADGARVPYGLLGFQRKVLADGGDWDMTPNARGYVPLYGPEGIVTRSNGFPWNNYTWTMQVLGGKLYIGTMDWDDINSPDEEDGADFFCIPSSDQPAVLVSGVGVANWSSYGIRTIEADESRGELYLGMANVHNLLNTTVGDPVSGGWEIQRVTMRYPDEDFDELDDDWETASFGDITTVNDPDGNTDGDPLSEWEEWLAGTDPTDAGSFFFAHVADSATEGLQEIRWDSVAGRHYVVLENDSLTGDWTAVAIYLGTGAALTHPYDPAASPVKFFKVLVSADAPPPLPTP